MIRRIVMALVLALAVAPLRAAADTIYLRDGRTVQGTVIGFIGGRFAVRVSTSGDSTEGEIQFFRPRDVDRVEIDGRSLEDARFNARTVEVTLAPNWIDSGVDVRRGERVQVKASGTIVAGRTRIMPDGLRSTDPTAPLPRSAEGVLIGAISNNPNAPIIELGLGREFNADRDGRLYLTVNRGTYTDARGAFTVQVRTERDFALRRNDATTNRRNDAEDDDDLFGTENRTAEPAPVRTRRGGGAMGNEPLDTRAQREVSVEVPGTSRGTDTRIDLIAGDQVTIEATGQIVAGRRVGSVPPEGGRAGLGSVFAGTYPMAQAGPGALIGFIRTADGQATAPFLVGSRVTFTAQVDGRLILLINDDNYADNSGSFSVRVRY